MNTTSMRRGAPAGRGGGRYVEALETRRFLAAGAFDTTLAGTGFFTHSFGTTQDALDTLVQPDGKIVVVGAATSTPGGKQRPFIARYTGAGALDTGFGSGGVTLFDFPGDTNDSFATAVARQSDGKLVVAGFSGGAGTPLGGDFLIARFTTSGAPDNSFSGDGRTTIDLGGTNVPSGVGVLADGKILVVGTVVNTTGVGIGMTRVLADGNIDTGFTQPGNVVARIVDAPPLTSGTGYVAGRMVLDASDRPVVAFTKVTAALGGGSVTVVGADMGVARYTTAGAVDTAFSSDGKAFVNVVATRLFEFGTAVAIDPRTGKIILAGTTATGALSFGGALPAGTVGSRGATRADYAVARFTVSGAPDSTFSADGKVRVDFDPADPNLLDGATGVECDASGRITVSGASKFRGRAENFSVARVSPGGAIDASFDGDGRRIIDLGGGDGAYAMTIQSDGNPVLTGVNATGGTRRRLAVIRLLDD